MVCHLWCSAPALPSLQKVTVKCPCGRRVSHTALPQGTAPKPIQCVAECERLKRSSRLADAFGIEDPGHYIPWADRQRWVSRHGSDTCNAPARGAQIRLKHSETAKSLQ